MDPRLEKRRTDVPYSGPGNDAPTRTSYGFMNYGTKLEKIRIFEFLGSLVVKVYEEFEIICLLFDDIQFRSRIHE
jgi:hypothetical protein